MLTACGIETDYFTIFNHNIETLQQCLPLAVLKLLVGSRIGSSTYGCNSAYRLRYWNTHDDQIFSYLVGLLQQCLPLAVLKLTDFIIAFIYNASVLLQQCLPLAVLKPTSAVAIKLPHPLSLQQCLPLAVLKPFWSIISIIENINSCNSAYRLRYWNEMIGMRSNDAA